VPVFHGTSIVEIAVLTQATKQTWTQYRDFDWLETVTARPGRQGTQVNEL
jgi:hypothetical protein